jgi:hypothetical protein
VVAEKMEVTINYSGKNYTPDIHTKDSGIAYFTNDNGCVVSFVRVVSHESKSGKEYKSFSILKWNGDEFVEVTKKAHLLKALGQALIVANECRIQKETWRMQLDDRKSEIE